MRSDTMRPLPHHGGFGWICVVWFISTLDVAVADGPRLRAIPEVVAKCGDNVTLICEVLGVTLEDIVQLFWMEKENKMCETEQSGTPKTEPFPCLLIFEADDHFNFFLPNMNLTPNKQGIYHCKIRTKSGADNTKTKVRVEDCVEDSHHSLNGSEAECIFSGVYPPGSVSWTIGGVAATDVNTTQTEEADGRFTIKSKVKKGKVGTTYTCSLLRPTNSTESTDRSHVVSKRVFSGSGVVKLAWICMLVEMVLLILTIHF